MTYATFEVYVKDPYENPVSGVNIRCRFHYRAKYSEEEPWVEKDDYISGPTNTDGYALFKLLKEIPPEPHDPDPNQMPLYPENLAQNGIYISIIYLPEEHWQTTYPRYDFEWMEVTIIDPEITILSSINTHSVLNTNVAQFNVVEDADGNGIYDVYELPLAEKFAPIYKIHLNNPLFPMPVEAVYGMNNATIVNNSSDYLPLPISNHNDVGWNNFFTTVLEPQFNNGTSTPTVYSHTYKTSLQNHGGSSTNYYVIHYWTYYPYDDALNVHEADWEHIDVIVDNWDPDYAQGIGAIYYQHRTSKMYNWNVLEKNGNHPIVYVGGRGELRIITGITKTRNGHEITGASFAVDGWHYSVDFTTKTSEGLIQGVVTWRADEEVNYNSGSIFNPTDYDLINMNISNPLWWMGYTGNWGAQKDVVKAASSYEAIYIDITIGFVHVQHELTFPEFSDPPKSPPYHEKWENMDRLDSPFVKQFPGRFSNYLNIQYTLLASTDVKIEFWNSASVQLLKTYNLGVKDAGTHILSWDWKNSNGNTVGHGSFVARIYTNPNNLFNVYIYYQ